MLWGKLGNKCSVVRARRCCTNHLTAAAAAGQLLGCLPALLQLTAPLCACVLPLPLLLPLPSAGVFKFDFEEEQDLDEAAVRRMVWEEMAHYDS